MAKVINAMGGSAVAAGGPRSGARSKQSKVKIASKVQTGALKGLVEDVLDGFDMIESDVDAIGEHIETVQTAIEHEGKMLHAAGAANLTKALKDFDKKRKIAAKAMISAKSAAAVVAKELARAVMPDAEPADESEDGDE